MKHFKQILFFSLAIFSLITLFACSESRPLDKQKTATDFVQAINQNDAAKAAQLTGSQLNIRNQQWESAPDGAGFVLGKTEDISLNSREKVKNWLSENFKKIGIEGKEPTKANLDLLKDELKGIEASWQNTDVYLFLRGMADVEHIFVIGIDSKGKVVALYFN